MKMCEQCKNKVRDASMYPNVNPGDVVKITIHGLALRQYYLVTQQRTGRTLHNLKTGHVWDMSSLWGHVLPSQVKKVEACFDIIEDKE